MVTDRNIPPSSRRGRERIQTKTPQGEEKFQFPVECRQKEVMWQKKGYGYFPQGEKQKGKRIVIRKRESGGCSGRGG